MTAVGVTPLEALVPGLFAWIGGQSLRVECTVCGRSGYAGGAWQAPCRRGHAQCSCCGRQMPIRLDGSPRVHTRCPRRQR